MRKIQYFLISFIAFTSFHSSAQNVSNRNSNILAVGLPVYAASISYLKGDEQGLIQLAESEALTLVAVEALKKYMPRTRPDGSDDQSFPSRHTAVSFSAAQYLYMKGGWEHGLPSYVVASYVGYARVDAKKHHWSDVLAGGVIGALATYNLTDLASSDRLSMYFFPGAASVVWQKSLN